MKALLRLQFYSLFGINKQLHKPDKAGRNQGKWMVVGIIALAILIFLSVSFYMVAIGLAYASQGMIEKLLDTMVSAGAVLSILLLIFRVQSTLFSSKDYEFLQTLPIKSWKIVFSKQVLLYIFAFLINFALLVPSAAVYSFFAKPPILFHIQIIIALFFTPMLPLFLAEIISSILSVFNTRSRLKNFFVFLFFVALITIYFCGMMGGMSDEKITSIGNGVSLAYPLAWLLNKGLLEKDILSYLLFLLFNLLGGIGAVVFGNLVYSGLNNWNLYRSNHKKFKMSAYKTEKKFSLMKTLIKKEISSVFAYLLFALNSCLGSILPIILIIIFSIVNPFQSVLNEVSGISLQSLGGLCAVGSMMFCGMTTPSACFISLEGKQFWILKSSPISYKQVIWSKIFASMIITLPSPLVVGIFLSITFQCNVAYIFGIMLLPICYVIFTNILGLTLNLWKPKLDYENLTQVVKQSLPVSVQVFSSIILSALIGVFFYFVNSPFILIGGAVLFLILSVVLIFILNSYGEKMYMNLQEA